MNYFLIILYLIFFLILRKVLVVLALLASKQDERLKERLVLIQLFVYISICLHFHYCCYILYVFYIYRCNDIPINRNWLAPLWNQSKLRRNPSTSKTTYRKKQLFNTYINSGVKNSKKRLRNSREKKSDHIFHFISALHPIFPLGNCVALLKISVKLLDILM